MIILTGGRASGKTSACIRWMLEDPHNRFLLVATDQRRKQVTSILHQALPQFSWTNHVGVFRDNQHNSIQFPEVGIDDLDACLENVFYRNVAIATLNATYIPLAPMDNSPLKADSYVTPELPDAQAEVREIEV